MATQRTYEGFDKRMYEFAIVSFAFGLIFKCGKKLKCTL